MPVYAVIPKVTAVVLIDVVSPAARAALPVVIQDGAAFNGLLNVIVHAVAADTPVIWPL